MLLAASELHSSAPVSRRLSDSPPKQLADRLPVLVSLQRQRMPIMGDRCDRADRHDNPVVSVKGSQQQFAVWMVCFCEAHGERWIAIAMSSGTVHRGYERLMGLRIRRGYEFSENSTVTTLILALRLIETRHGISIRVWKRQIFSCLNVYRYRNCRKLSGNGSVCAADPMVLTVGVSGAASGSGMPSGIATHRLQRPWRLSLVSFPLFQQRSAESKLIRRWLGNVLALIHELVALARRTPSFRGRHAGSKAEDGLHRRA